MRVLRFLQTAVLAAVCSFISLAQAPQDGLWYLSKAQAVVHQGMVEGDAFTFAAPLSSTLPAGSYIQFCVSLENAGEMAPLHYKVEFFDGGEWVSDPSFVYQDGLSDYSFRTVSASVKHPSTFTAVYKLKSEVSDSLRARCRVCSPYATNGSLLSKEEKGNTVALKNRHYVAAKLVPLGSGEGFPQKRILLTGNSFTYYFGEAFMLQEIAFAQGWILQLNASLKGGMSFRQHCGLEMTQAQCELPCDYDFAILQGQSQEPGKYAAAPDSLADVRSAFCELCGRIRSSHPSCRVFAERTWAYPASDNGGFASMEEFDEMLSKGTSMIAEAAGCEINPVGEAFARARSDVPSINLLHKDQKHQSLAGSYLKACISWLTISGRTRFEGTVPSCGLSSDDAAALRAIAEKVASGR